MGGRRSLYSSVMHTATLPPARDRRFAGLALTVLVHAVLLLGWQMSRRLPPVDSGPEPVRTRIQWIRLPAPSVPRRLPEHAPAPAAAPARPAPAPARAAAPPVPVAAQPAAPVPAAPSITVLPAAPATSAVEPAPAAPTATPGTDEILRRARRDIGKIDRDLRKENNPYIVAPPDSPAIRMRKGMETARDLAPPRIWEAPKIEALVNNTGDGARRERVITGNGTYCVTDRGINTSIDMLEKHGKQRITNCPQHETPASRQEWRTARD